MNKYKIVLYANNNEKREKGLMFHDDLDSDECALFSFPRGADHAFWNKNVSFPLKLVFCDIDNKVVAIKKMEAESTAPCKSHNANVKYVIEANINSFDDINVGDTLIIDDEDLYFVNK